MLTPPVPPDEAQRMQSLRDLNVLDSMPEIEFDALVKVAAAVCAVPVALISLVDTERQWFKASHGWQGAMETPRAISFCGHAILGDDIFEIPDAKEDPRFADTPLVAATNGIRFYAGAPLCLSDGAHVGTLCVIDHQPHRLDTRQRELLRCLANTVARALEGRRAALQLKEEQRRHQAISEATQTGTWEWNLQTGELRINEQWANIAGYTVEELKPLSMHTYLDRIHPDDLAIVKQRLQKRLDGYTQYSEIDARMRHRDGHWLHTLVRGRVMSRTPDGKPEWLVGILLNHSAYKLQEAALRKSQNFLSQTGKLARVGGWEHDLVSGKAYWSDELCQILGVPLGYQPMESEGIGFVGAESQPEILAAIEHSKISGEEFDREAQFIRATGQPMWIRAMGRFEYEQGQAVRMIGALQDVSGQLEQRRAVDEARIRMDLATDAGRIGVWDYDIATQRFSIDNWVCRHHGLPDGSQRRLEELDAEFLHPDDRERCQTMKREALELKRPFDFEYRVVWADGSVHHLHNAARISHDAAGHPIRIVGVIYDITTMKEQEATIRKGQEFLRRVGQLAGVGGWEYDAVTGVITLSEESSRIIGLNSAACLTTEQNALLYAPEYRAQINEAFQKVVLGGDGWDTETQVIRADGKRIWVHSRASADREHGRLVRIVGAAMDVTERVEQRQAIEAAHDRLALATDAGRIGIWDYNIVSDNFSLSALGCRMHGLPPDATPGMHQLIATAVHPDDIESVQEHLRAATAGGLPIDVEYRILWPDGSVHYLHDVAKVIRDDAGNPLRLTGAIWDVTAQKEQEAMTHKDQEFLRQVGQLAGVGGWELDIDRGIITLAEQTSQIFGFDGAACVTLEQNARFYDAETHAKVWNAFQRIDQGESGWDMETPLIRADGKRIWVHTMALGKREKGRLVRLIGATMDVTERFEQRRAIEAARDRLALATEGGHIGVFEYDVVADQFHMDDWMCRLHGLPLGSEKNLPAIIEMVHSDDRALVAEHVQQLLDGKRLFDDEYRVIWPDGSVHYIHTMAQARRDSEGRALSAIGVMWDITERKMQEEALRTSEDLLDRSGRLAHVGGWEFSPERGGVYYSPEACRIHGIPEGLMPTPEEVMRWYAAEDRADMAASIDAALHNGKGWDKEHLVTRPDGRKVWIRSVAEVDFAPGKPPRIFGAVQDVTERVEQNRAIQEARDRIALATDAGQIGIWDYDFLTDRLTLSPWAYRICGLPEDTDWRFQDLIAQVPHPDDRAIWEKALQESLSGKPSIEIEFRIVRADGRVRHVVSVARTTYDATGRALSTIGALWDITKRKQQEEALRTSEALLDRSGRMAHVGGWEFDTVMGIVSYSPEACRIYGIPVGVKLTREELLQSYPPEIRDDLLACHDKAIHDGQGWDKEFSLIRRDGQHIWIRSFAEVEKLPGKPVRIVGAVQDVTERVAQRRAIQEARDRIALATDAGRIGIWEYEIASNSLLIDDWMCRLHGLPEGTPRSIQELMDKQLHPDDRPTAEKLMQQTLLDGKRFDSEYRIYWPDGSLHYLHTVARTMQSPAGKNQRLIGATWDITAQKELEAALRKSQSVLDRTGRMAGVGGWELDLRTNEVFWSDETCRIHGAPPGFRPTMEDALRCYPPEAQRRLDKAIEEGIRNKQGWELELPLVQPDGQKRWVSSLGIPEFEGGRLVRFLGAVQDVTERHNTAAAMRSTLALQTAIFDSADFSIISTDLRGIITTFNTAAERMLGYREQDMVGIATPLRIHDADEIAARAAELSREMGYRIEPGFEVLVARIDAKGGAEQSEWTYVRANGSRFPVLCSITAIRAESGEVIGSLCIAADISDRKQKEQAISMALKEKETLLKEVYHRVKNNLQVINSLLNLQQRALPEGVARQILRENAERIRVMAMVHEKLYMSSNLSLIRLDEYINDLCNGLSASYAIRQRGISLQCKTETLEISLEQAIPLGLILNETVTNSLKHGYPEGRQGEVVVTLLHSATEATISVQDDGVGLPDNFSPGGSISLGLKLVSTLCRQLNGQIRYDSTAGAGTCFTLTIPLPADESKATMDKKPH